MYIPLRPIPREDTLRGWRFYKVANTNWQTNVLDSRKVTQLNLLRLKSLKFPIQTNVHAAQVLKPPITLAALPHLRRFEAPDMAQSSGCPQEDRLVGLVVKASASRAEGPGFESRLRRDFFGVESHQGLKNWHFSGYPARHLAL